MADKTIVDLMEEIEVLYSFPMNKSNRRKKLLKLLEKYLSERMLFVSEIKSIIEFIEDNDEQGYFDDILKKLYDIARMKVFRGMDVPYT